MFKFFKRGRKATRVERPVIRQIKGYVEKNQRRLAHWLQVRINRMSPRKLTICLIGFCIASSSICVYLLINALVPSLPVLPAIPQSQVSPPRSLVLDTVFVYPNKTFNN